MAHHENPILILIIDDDQDLLDLVSTALDAAGYRSVQARSGLDGIKEFNACTPSLVILDVTMPELDGLQTCRAIRAGEKNSHVPILILTGRSDITDMLEADKVGADDYLVKPFEASSLLKKIRRLIQR